MTDIEKDAARYRWLRATQNAEFRDAMFAEGSIECIMVCEEPGDYGSSCGLWPDELDAAIDTAMKRWPDAS